MVFVGGLTGDVEGEEMTVSYPGFSGGDRTDLALPSTQDKLLRAVQATGKPIVLVLMTGSAIAVEWAQKNVPAIVVGWYPGQQGGNAVADVLFGDVNPAGRLPVTFYKSVEQLPPFADYDMKGRTYRYFAGDPLYPFGHGLSYTRFEYSDLRVDRRARGRAGHGERVRAREERGRAGRRRGRPALRARRWDEGAGARTRTSAASSGCRSLRASSGRSPSSSRPRRRSRATIRPRREWPWPPGDYELQVGASSRDIRLTSRLGVRP